jgi:hypothetical protein
MFFISFVGLLAGLRSITITFSKKTQQCIAVHVSFQCKCRVFTEDKMLNKNFNHLASCGLNSAGSELITVFSFCVSEIFVSNNGELLWGKWSSS